MPFPDITTPDSRCHVDVACQLMLMQVVEPALLRSDSGKVELITGRGLHSPDGKPKTRPRVFAHYRNHPLGFYVDEVTPGTVIVAAGRAWWNARAITWADHVAQAARHRIVEAAMHNSPECRGCYEWLDCVSLFACSTTPWLLPEVQRRLFPGRPQHMPPYHPLAMASPPSPPMPSPLPAPMPYVSSLPFMRGQRYM
ncbi:hypothetical protein JKP88DRAFT_247553 [Tribonema minus]|uniref:Smr domain-containing protein n=1 Tax=Tribonema minus TaxID=303371 RepID=A0A835YQH4_9STRA|nr:hypothetical protein JKP88DRAFT_247553 [Tribonema minus]